MTDLAEELQAPLTAQPTWLGVALRHLAGRPTAVVVRGDDGGTRAIALLSSRRRGLVRNISLLGDGVNDHARLLAVDDAASAALADGVAALLGRQRGPWRFRAQQLPHGDPVARRLAEMLPHSTLADGDVCPVTLFGPDRSLTAHVSKNGRTIASQGRNRLTREDPDWRIERVRDPDQVAALLPSIVTLHRSRDHALGRRSDLDTPSRAAFYVNAATELAREGKLELATLRVRGDIAAYLVVMLDGPVWRFWDNRIDDAYAHLRVGRVLDTTLLAAALSEEGVCAVDWMRGQMQHKKQASNDVIRTVGLSIWSGAAVRALETGTGTARRVVRDLVPADLRKRIRGRARTPDERVSAGSSPSR